jgi:glycosyltransferase involved in cell wall biosynthesis
MVQMRLKQNFPKVSIGIPVYNGEHFLDEKIKSILDQTFSNYEIIISDNASTDKTSIICNKFAKNEPKIRYIRQEKNIGVWGNFNFVLKEAKGDYFLWSSVDDMMLPTYLEKILDVISSNKNISCCFTKIKLYGECDNLKKELKFSLIEQIKKKFTQLTLNGELGAYSAKGPYKKRVNTYFKNMSNNQIFYGMYRTEQIKKSFVKKSFLWYDAATILNILKYGELYVVDEVLLRIFDGGICRSGMISVMHILEPFSLWNRVFPYSKLTRWCFKNLTKKIFFKHLKIFILINCYGEAAVILDNFRMIQKKIRN